MVGLVGERDELLKLIEAAFEAQILVRGNEITVTGDAEHVERVSTLFEELIELIERGTVLNAENLVRSIDMIKGISGETARPSQVLSDAVLVHRGKAIKPKTLGQKKYVDAIRASTIVFGIGPAGTGKTYLAMAMAVKALQEKQVARLILTRPAVEAGEKLGFLPGTLYEKIDPYMRPLYDALYDMMDPESLARLTQRGTIEVSPLAFMRGRAQPVTSRVLTPEGWREIGSLQVGDLVIGSHGSPVYVLGVHPQGRKPVYRVWTQDGASTLACGEHQWAVSTAADRRRGKPRRILQTSEMIGRERTAHQHRYELPLLSHPAEFQHRRISLDPYALGLLPADAAEAARAGGRGGVIVADPITRSSTKFIPDSYLYNTPSVRLAVLQGLLDSDGEPARPKGRTGRIQYTTASSRLREDVVFLVRSLGGVASSRTRPVHHRHDAHIVDIRLPAGIQPFRLSRKAALYDDDGGGRPMRFIDRIEPAGNAETVCISVSAQNSLYVTDDFLVTHNTLNDSFIILDEAQNTTPEQMKMFLTRLGFGSKVVVTGDVSQIDLPSGQSSGLNVVREILTEIDGLHFVFLGSKDVVRHSIVQEIVEAYRRFDEAH